MSRARVLQVVAVVAFLGVTSIATSAQEWTGAATPTEIWAGQSGTDAYVKGLANVAACSTAVVRFTSTDSDPERIQHLAAAAFMSGNRIDCTVDGCDGIYQSGRRCYLKQ